MPPERRSKRKASLKARSLIKESAIRRACLKSVPVVNMKKSQVIKDVKVNMYPIFKPTRIRKDVCVHSGSSRFVSVDDDDGHLNFDLGDVLIERYRLTGFLGKGTFGRVARAIDLYTRRTVAVKIVKNEDSCRESGEAEIDTMKRLRGIDPLGQNRWVKMLDYFEFWGHVFIVFEMLGDDLYTFMKDIEQPYLLSQIKHIAYQLVSSVKALHNNLMVHTDLKPENICFINSDDIHGSYSLRQRSLKYIQDSSIRLIDFGSTIHLTDTYRGIIQTRHYRCPEVIFGMKWSYPSDVWSIGCILFELYHGSCLFLVNTDEDHIKAMEDTLGTMPPLFKNTCLGRCVDRSRSPASRKIRKNGKNCKNLRKFMKSTSVEHLHFFEFLEECLQYDPMDRITLDAALKHPFIASLPRNLKA